MKLLRVVMMVMLLALLVTACGGAEEATPEPPPIEAPAEVEQPEPTAEATATAEPTPEPTHTPEPTATATPEPAADLSGLAAGFVPYESIFSGISLAHPPDWVFEDFFFTIFASSAEMLDSAMTMEDDIPEGLDENLFGLLIALSAEEAGVSSAEEMLDQALSDFEMTETDGEIIEGPVEMRFNDQPGVYLIAVGEEDGTELAILYLAIFNEELERTAVLIGVTAPASMDQFLPLLLAMADTIEIVEPDMESMFDFDFDLDDFNDRDALIEPGHLLILSETLAEEEEHHYNFIATDLGTITAAVTPLAGLDVVLEIYDEDDELLLQVDESFGDELLTFTGTEALGLYTLVVRGYADQGGDYIINLETNSGVTLFLVTGDEVISLLGEAARLEYAILLEEGQTVTASALPESSLDILLEIYDIDEELLLTVDDGLSGESELLIFTAPAGGVYFLVARGFAGDIGQYSLMLEIE